MKNYKQILEAINEGIRMALDDYQNTKDNDSISYGDTVVNAENVIQQRIDLNNYTVDLGLPSGTRWCKYNLGCDYDLLNKNPKQTNPEDWYGIYYAWGELKPKGPRESYELRDYKFKDLYKCINFGEKDKLYKYTSTDNLTRLLPEDDAATQNMHLDNFSFCVPSKKQFKELIDNTDYTWQENYKDIKGLNGIELVSKINDQKLFIPAAGGYDFDSHGYHVCNNSAQIEIKVWSSDLTTIDKNMIFANVHKAFILYYTSKKSESSFFTAENNTLEIIGSQRWNGFSIRPVLK